MMNTSLQRTGSSISHLTIERATNYVYRFEMVGKYGQSFRGWIQQEDVFPEYSIVCEWCNGSSSITDIVHLVHTCKDNLIEKVKWFAKKNELKFREL